MKKLLGATLVALVVTGVVLYFVSDHFRAWARHPRFMWECSIDKGLPDPVCEAGAAAKDLVDATLK